MPVNHDPRDAPRPPAAATGPRLEQPSGRPLDLAAVRRRLRAARGPRFWRSLEELAGTPEFEELVEREFGHRLPGEPGGVDRRRFVQLMGASLALGGLTACTRQPLERIVPYVEQPENLVPGKPLFYATAAVLGGYATGLLAESHMGRPTKLEGNPEHPASLGATDLLTQAEMLGLYDPDRSQVVRNLGRIRNWTAFADETRAALQALDALGGARLRILTGTVTSPSLAALLDRLRAERPRARWHQFEPVSRDHARAGLERAFGEPLAPRYDLSRAAVVLALDADLLTAGPGSVRYARDFMARRRLRDGGTAMNRLWAVESSPTLTATVADHRLALAPSEVARFAAALAAELGVPGVEAAAVNAAGAAWRPWLSAVARDLDAHRGAAVVVPGDYAPPEVQVLAHALNDHLGAAGATVLYADPVEAEPMDQGASLAELVGAMRAGEVDVLLVAGCNPVYDAPADLDFTGALQQVPRRIRLGLYEDETSEYCQWHLPEAHFLESWGDARAFDGTASVVQPLIEPLYGGRSLLEVLSVFTADGAAAGYDLVRDHWRREWGDDGFEPRWRRALHDGLVADSAPPSRRPALLAGAAADAAAAIAGTPPSAGLELIFRPDPTVWDGRFANNAWLQECPKPLTKLTWDNAVLVGPALAQRLGIESEQVVELRRGERTLEVPAWVLPGHPDGCVTLHLGYGRRRAGRVGTGTGFDAYRLRTSEAPWTAGDLELTPARRRHPLASTQLHHNIALEGREATKRHLVRTASLDRYRREPEFAQHIGHAPDPGLTLYPPVAYEGHAWGLAVDLGACTGCNACVVACQSENNVPVVGKQQVALGREMHWIRIDRYFEGSLDEPHVHHQPVMCMHCEQAPCEVVCPVAATVHSDEGLNDMVYNRCVGTRYCSNNCPYKVRRFNFLKYNDLETPVLKLLRNPDVTVRTRGVMEKCTYCVQRINGARIEAKREGRAIRDGEIQTACQQVCPTRAIAFGDLNDPDSEVASWKAAPLNYDLLAELGTRPRTSYLARVTNPSPQLEGGGADAGHGHGGEA